MTDPKTFWEEKILHWEEGRYNLVNSHSIMTLESVANKSSSSLRFRIEKSAELLSEFVTDKNVVEIGCGRALLARTLLDAGAKSYLGIDITDSAIGVAKELHKDLISVGKANFIQGDISTLRDNSADIIFSLGLLDWLNDQELLSLFRHCPEADHFHTISEHSRTSALQFFHRIYVYISYGYRTDGYVPRYYTEKKILNLMQGLTASERFVYRSKYLDFGAFVATLNIGEKIVDW